MFLFLYSEGFLSFISPCLIVKLGYNYLTTLILVGSGVMSLFVYLLFIRLSLIFDIVWLPALLLTEFDLIPDNFEGMSDESIVKKF